MVRPLSSIIVPPLQISPYSFSVTAITDLLTQGVLLEDVQYSAGHAEPRTTGLYDRRQKKMTRNIVLRLPGDWLITITHRIKISDNCGRLLGICTTEQANNRC